MTAEPGLSAARIADVLGGRVVGDASLVLDGVRSLAQAGPSHLSFFSHSRYAQALQETRAGAVLVGPLNRTGDTGPVTRIVVENPVHAAARALSLFHVTPSIPWGVAPSARLGFGTTWSGRVHVGPHAVVGARVRLGQDCVVQAGARIEDDVACGDHCHIGPQAVVHAGARLGDRVVLEAGARVGGPGFGFIPGPDGPERFPHVGACDIGDDVEVGANATVDRGKLDATIVGRGSKIDNLAHVGHTVRIGERCIIMAQVGIAGSCVVEDDVMLAGQAGIADHVTIGHGARVAAQSGVIGDVPAGATVSGYPARPHREVLRQAATMRRLAPLVGALERVASSS